MLFSSTSLSALGAISFLASAGHATRPNPPIQPVRRQAPPGFVSVPLAQLQMLQIEYNTFRGWMTTYISSANSSDPKVAQLDQDVLAYGIYMNTFLSSYSNSSTPAGATITPVSSMPAATSAPAAPFLNSSSKASFNAQSQRNVAVYYGQTPHTNKVTVDQLCQDQNVDIVVLSFLDTYFDAAGMPNINIGPACSGDPTVGAQAINATGLLDCPFLAKNITTCQSLGKKVFLSLGGATGTTNFTSDAQATTFASTLWNLFGGGNTTSNLRPFGSVRIDGFDVDNEDHSTDHYNVFISALRKTFDQDKTKQYYISAAPQCPRPDESIPLAGMQSMDFVFVQFYNNAAAKCDIGQEDFIKSLKAWSDDLSGNSTVPGKGPKLFVGAPASAKSAGKGYLEPADMGKVIKSAMAANISNFGGVMLWDGTEAKLNTGDGGDYLKVIKSALTS